MVEIPNDKNPECIKSETYKSLMVELPKDWNLGCIIFWTPKSWMVGMVENSWKGKFGFRIPL